MKFDISSDLIVFFKYFFLMHNLKDTRLNLITNMFLTRMKMNIRNSESMGREGEGKRGGVRG